MADQPTTRDQLIERAADVIKRGFDHVGDAPYRMKAARALADAGLLADPGIDQSASWVLARVRKALGTPDGRAVSVHAAEVRAELERLRAQAVEVKRLDDEAYLRHRDALYAALGCAGPEGSLIALITENVAAVVAERDALQARVVELTRERDLAVAHDRQPYPTAWAYEQACRALRDKQARIDAALALHVEHQQNGGRGIPHDIVLALTGDQPAEPGCCEHPAAHAVAEPDVTPPDPSGRITDHGPVQPFTDTDHEVPNA